MAGRAEGPLLVLDQKPFLKKALASCRRLRTELNRKQSLLEAFESEDLPAFQRWHATTFGGTLSRIRAAREEAGAWEFILSQLQVCARFEPRKVPDLHAELLERREAGSLFEFVSPYAEKMQEEVRQEKERAKHIWEAFFGGGDDEAWEDFGDEEESYDDYRSFSDETSEDPSGGKSRPAGGGSSARGHRTGISAGEQRAKACYRKLAKRLHPDHSDMEETVRARRWEEMQEAYQRRDIDALLRVEAVCDMDDHGLSLKLGMARLRELAHYHQSHLRPLRKALREAKRHPAFGFAKRGPSIRTEREIRDDLAGELREIRYDAGELRSMAESLREEVEEFLEEEARRAARARRPRKHARATRKKARRKPGDPEPETRAEPGHPEQLRFF